MKSHISSKKRHASGQSQKRVPNASVICAAAFGAAIALVVSIVLALICAMICTASGEADKLLTPLSFVGIVIAYFVGGFVAAKRKAAALPVGALCGAALTALFFVVSLFMDASLSSGLPIVVSLLIRLSLIVVSIFGALLGTNAKKPHRRRR